MNRLLTLSMLCSLMLAVSAPAMADPVLPVLPPCESKIACGPGAGGAGAVINKGTVTVFRPNNEPLVIDIGPDPECDLKPCDDDELP